MTFTAWYYPFFLVIVAIFYWQVPYRTRLFLLLSASYFFYAYWDLRFLSLIMASTAMDFLCGRAIDGHRASLKTVLGLSFLPTIWLLFCHVFLNSSNTSVDIILGSALLGLLFTAIYNFLWKFAVENRGKKFYFLTLTYNLGLLGFFKYFNFFIDQARVMLELAGFEASGLTLNILLPVGISFYTFQSISYATDIYFKKEKSCSDLLLFSTFISFFPQLVAGPIQRTHQLLPQLAEKQKFKVADIESGIKLILVGYFKKVFVGDNCALIANYFFSESSEMNLAWIIIGSLAFAFQIYGDFSGYTDIARGSARIFGIELSRNFIFPYYAHNPSDFWKRWHISLSTWIRDYLYIPLGGNSGSPLRTSSNLLVAMVLAGLWHGAAWNFVLWGIYHAALLIGYRFIPILARSGSSIGWSRYLYIFMMFCLTLLGWLIFRSPDIDFLAQTLSGIFQTEHFQSAYKPGLWLLLHITPLLVLQYVTRDSQDEAMFNHRSWKWQIVDYTVMLLLVASSTSQNQEFIYFQF